MRTDFEEMILGNPVLGAVCTWEFIHKFEFHRTPLLRPSLLHILPVLPIVLRRKSAESLKTMQFESGLTKFLADDPTIVVDLQDRIAAWTAATLQSINIGCAAGLFEKVIGVNGLEFKSSVKALPSAIQPEGITNTKALAARRLGAFFRDESLVQIQSKLRISL